MIDKNNFKTLIESMGFKPSVEGGQLYEKYYIDFDCTVKVDFEKKKLIYPEEKGFRVNDTTTCNFEHPENFVVFECINRLLLKGYRPEHLELEKRWQLGHEAKSGKADICVYDKNGTDILCIIECKTYGLEYTKELNNMRNDGGQLFSYWQQERSTKWLTLYASTLLDGKIYYKTESVDCSDDANILELFKKDNSVLVYKNAYSVSELYSVWDETYEKRLCGDVIFRDDTQSYNIGVKPLRKKDLVDFSENDKIVNKFEEILRHNNVSDKENAFNRLIALFICKLVDEIQKGDEDIVEFQYKVGTDTYESLQDRLQKLHKEGMEKFMREEIIYVSDDYAENLVQQYTGQKRQKMIQELKGTLRILKFYTNNDFAFKDVHNEELFYQNGKILVEVVQLFEGFRIIGSQNLQLLGDLFEQLLNKGFKQNEGQFFTPIPITRFIWDSLPLDRVIRRNGKIEVPKIVDYACGAGHFLTEAFEAVVAYIRNADKTLDNDRSWVEEKLYGIEKDYRLARVSKISLFMHGAGDGNIIFGDGLENYVDKNITPGSFDILVANPPYSVSAFKPHLKLKENNLLLLDKISNNGSEIETLFVERISQLVKPQGVAAVILPSSILNKEAESFVGSREAILQNFYIRAIVQFGSRTFGATGTSTIVLFLEKFNEPPKRKDMVSDSINAIFENQSVDDWEDEQILEEYLDKIGVNYEEYRLFLEASIDYTEWKEHDYFQDFVESFESLSIVTQKKKQKSFQKSTDKEKMKWLNDNFYEYAYNIEKEKLQYFAYVYTQMTLVIQSPDDNKEQKEFLGYDWSNRKGSEGIQIIQPGGKLYDDTNRFAENTISSLVRNMYYDNLGDLPQLESYYYYMRLQDMIDFRGTSFNKIIKTTKVRDKKPKEGFKLYKLSSKVFEAFLGDRVVANEQLLQDGKIPVYSANVFEPFGYINDQNITDFSCDSVIWGIDGDWMVNVIPAGKPFYPTDHCGVLRIKTNEIIPAYLALALEVEGRFERFSRSNRASTQRVKALSLLIPEHDKQQEIVDYISEVDKKIAVKEHELKEYNKAVNEKFNELFGDPDSNPRGWDILTINDVCSSIVRGPFGSSLKKEFFVKPDETTYKVYEQKHAIQKSADIGTYYITSDKFNDLQRFECKPGDIIMSCSGTMGEFYQLPEGCRKGIINQALCKFTLNEKVLPKFFLVYMSKTIGNLETKGTGIKNIASVPYVKAMPIHRPPNEIQQEFEDYVVSIDDVMVNLQNELIELRNQREALIDQYFS